MKTLLKQNFKLGLGIIVLLLTFIFLCGQQAWAGTITDSISNKINWATSTASTTYDSLRTTTSQKIGGLTSNLGSLTNSLSVNSLTSGATSLGTKFSNFGSSLIAGGSSFFSSITSVGAQLLQFTRFTPTFNANAAIVDLGAATGGISNGLSDISRQRGIATVVDVGGPAITATGKMPQLNNFNSQNNGQKFGASTDRLKYK